MVDARQHGGTGPHPSPRTRILTVVLMAAAGLSVLASLLIGIAVQPAALLNDMHGRPWDPTDIVDPLDYVHGLGKPHNLPDGANVRQGDATGRVTLTFRNAAFLGRDMSVTARLASAATPLTVTLSMNGVKSGTFALSSGLRDYTASLDTTEHPNPNIDPSHVQVDLTVEPPGAGQSLAVSQVRLRAQRSVGEMLWQLLAVLFAGAVVLGAGYGRLGAVWAASYALGAVATCLVLQATYVPRGIPPAVEAVLAGLAWLLAVLLAPRRAPAWGLALAALGVWLVVAGRVLGEWQMDDAYISYRYAWNLAHGHGLVYNPGEVVEGYTNFSWTLLAALAIVAGAYPAWVMLAGTVAAAICIAGLTWHLSSRLAGGRYPWPLLAAGFVAIDSAIISYGARGSGMEAAPFGALVLLSAALIWNGQERRGNLVRALGGFALALASLTRPEGLMVAGLFIGVRALQDRRAGRPVLRPFLHAVLPFLAIMVPYEVWRISFYGYPFPNTFYAKTGTTAALIERGLSHVSFFIGDDWLLVALGVVGVLFALAKRQRLGLHGGLALLVTVYTLYIIWAGGDHFPGWRFFVPLIGPLALLSQEAVRLVLGHLAAPRVAWGGAALLAGLIGLVYAVHMVGLILPGQWLDDRTKLHTTYVNRWGDAGLWLRDNTPLGTSTAAKGAGAIAYYSERTVIDMYGLNDLHIGHLDVATMGEGNPGHDKQDPAYVLLDRKPTYILDEWVSDFKPVMSQLKQQYTFESSRSALGPQIGWWKRR